MKPVLSPSFTYTVKSGKSVHIVVTRDWLKSLFRKALTLFDLSWEELLLLLQALVLLPIVALSLQLWGIMQTQKALAYFSQTGLPISSENLLPQVEKTTRMVGIAARYSPLWANCLKKSLVLWCLLRNQGINSALQIGVRREKGEFQAHAWVEYQGIVLNDTPDIRQKFVVFEKPLNIKV